MEMTILVPMAGPSLYFNKEVDSYPKPLMQVAGRTMLEYVSDYLMKIPGDNRFVFVIDESEARKFHLDNILKIIFKDKVDIILQRGKTKGAVCSALLAIDHLDNDKSLIISNCDQVITTNLREHVEYFQKEKADAGVICFQSIHPKWSYASVGNDNRVIEVAEKKTISKNAIAGFYYFNQGKTFIRVAQRLITKGASVNDLYYIAPTLNEVILEGGLVKMATVDNANYNSFYNASYLSDFEQKVKSGQIQIEGVL